MRETMKLSRSILDRDLEYVPSVAASFSDTWRHFGWRPLRGIDDPCSVAQSHGGAPSRPQGVLLRTGFSLFAAVAVAAVLTACGKGGVQAEAPPAQASVAQVVVKPVRQWDEFSGRIAATDTVEVRARVSGYIERIAFKEGDEVKSGDLLFVIDPRPYKAGYDSAAAQLERVRAAAQLASSQEQRAQTLIVANAISREEFDTRRAALTQGGADVRAAEAALETAKLNLGFTEVRSPIAGHIS